MTDILLASDESTAYDAVKRRALPWSLSAGVLNTFFAYWTFGGSMFLLFLDELGLPKERIGWVLSLFPFCGVLALGFAPLATQWGRKRTFLAGYGIRKFVMAGLLLLPWIIGHAGRGAGMTFLFVTITVFALLRAIAETGYYPWLQEFVPNAIRGQYTGVAAVLSMLASVTALFVAGSVVGTGHALGHFLLLIGMGCVLGFLGVVAMAPVPGGRPQPAEALGDHPARMGEALHDRNLVAFLAGLGAVTLGCACVTSFLPIFLKDTLGVASGSVVRLDTAVMIGTGVASLCCGWLADRVGSRPVLLPMTALCLLVPLGWLLAPRHGGHPLAWCISLQAIYGLANGGITVTAGRLLFNGVVPPDKSTAYTAWYYAWIGLTGGLGPLLAGYLLTTGANWHPRFGTWTPDAFSLLFALALLLLAVGWWCYGRVRPDGVTGVTG